LKNGKENAQSSVFCHKSAPAQKDCNTKVESLRSAVYVEGVGIGTNKYEV